MSPVPTPAQIAGRFRPRSQPKQSQRPVPLPHGWVDDLTLPLEDRHFYIDTGIFHSLAGLERDRRDHIAPFIHKHEHNDTIRSEVLTQKDEPLYSLRLEIVKLAQDCSRRECSLGRTYSAIETIRNELVADSQLRRGATDAQSRDKHSGEAELIHLAELHSPTAALVSNDAGASAVAGMHGVKTMHFVHLVRAAVSAGLSLEDGLLAARQGLSVSRLAGREESRTCNSDWLRKSASQ